MAENTWQITEHYPEIFRETRHAGRLFIPVHRGHSTTVESGGSKSPGRCPVPARPFVITVKARHPACRKTQSWKPQAMNEYLVSIHHPDDYNPFLKEDEAMHREIDVLNEEMIAAGIRVFAGGLHFAREAKSVQLQPDGKVLVTDGPYLKTSEHVGGFWILKAASMDEALEWGKKAAIACRAPVEVRQFHGM